MLGQMAAMLLCRAMYSLRRQKRLGSSCSKPGASTRSRKGRRCDGDIGRCRNEPCGPHNFQSYHERDRCHGKA